MLLFFDIDGTLIGEKSGKMPESTKRAVTEARRNGHICVINTGRSGKLVGPDITGLVEFDGRLMGCGTMIVYHDEVLFHTTFSVEQADRIIQGLRKYKIDAVLEGAEDNFRDAYEKIHTEKFRNFMRSFEPLNYRSYEEAPGHFDKFYCYVEDPNAVKAFMEEMSDLLEAVDRKQGFYEIMPKGYSKASAMRVLAERLNIPMEETVAIGDSSNDIPMLQCAAVSIAMGNATGDVKEICDYVTTDVEQDGIENALKWLHVI